MQISKKQTTTSKKQTDNKSPYGKYFYIWFLEFFNYFRSVHN